MITTGGPNVFVAGMHRSGGIHIMRVLGDLLGYRQATTAGLHGEGTEEQNINYISAGILMPYGYQIFHQHMKATPSNVEVLKKLRIKPIVVTRNLADVVVSLHDRYFLEGPMTPGVYVPSDFLHMERQRQYIWIIDNVVPWCLQFYASWWETDLQHLMVNYDDHFRCQVLSFNQMLEFLELEIHPGWDSDRLEDAAAKTYNKNIGKAGRGAKELGSTVKEIEKLALTWGPKWYQRFENGGLL